MSLIKCPECGKSISEFANFCPGCRCPQSLFKKSEEKHPEPDSIAFEKSLKLGQTIEFGKYPYYEDGREAPIKWNILDIKKDKVLLISEECLDRVKYNASYNDTVWEYCSLREWLNTEFYNKAFNAREHNLILLSHVTADINPYHKTDPGKDTEDNVFCLSVYEAKFYFKTDTKRRAAPTPYALSKGVDTDKRYLKKKIAACCWWLRTPGEYNYNAAMVHFEGRANCIGRGVYYSLLAVRPAMWVSIDAF